MATNTIFPLLLSRLYSTIGTIHYPDFSGQKAGNPPSPFSSRERTNTRSLMPGVPVPKWLPFLRSWINMRMFNPWKRP